jgi:hypothetical protein
VDGFEGASSIRSDGCRQTRDVFEQYPLRAYAAKDPGDGRPEVAFVSDSSLEPGDAERLAREARRDDIHASTPASAVEGAKVVPDRSFTQRRVRHSRHERGRCSCFPLNETHSSVSGFGEVEPEFEAASPGT